MYFERLRVKVFLLPTQGYTVVPNYLLKRLTFPTHYFTVSPLPQIIFSNMDVFLDALLLSVVFVHYLDSATLPL